MKPSHPSTPVCRRCQYYEPQGRRGGHCQQFDVAVQGGWTACALAIPPFTPAWENFEDIMAWQRKTLAAMQDSVAADALQDDLYFNETAALPCNSAADRPSAEASLSSKRPNQTTQSLSGTSRQVKGIQALWM